MVLQNLFRYICMYLQIIFQCQVYSLLCTFELFMEIVCNHYLHYLSPLLAVFKGGTSCLYCVDEHQIWEP
jgi:hypothetical protein